jgi:hypothetical protein
MGNKSSGTSCVYDFERLRKMRKKARRNVKFLRRNQTEGFAEYFQIEKIRYSDIVS